MIERGENTQLMLRNMKAKSRAVITKDLRLPNLKNVKLSILTENSEPRLTVLVSVTERLHPNSAEKELDSCFNFSKCMIRC